MKKGFTLIELLVVMVIIAMLVGLLLPALGAARDMARTTACKSNLRQIGMAFFLYTYENRGYFPPAQEDGYWGGDNCKRWTGVRKIINASAWPIEYSDYDCSKGLLDAHLMRKSKELLTCPSFRNYLTPDTDDAYIDSWGYGGAFESGAGGYGYNFAHVGSRIAEYGYTEMGYKHTRRETDFPIPADVILVTDAAMAQVPAVGGARYAPDEVGLQKLAYAEYPFCEPPFYLESDDWMPPLSPNPNSTWGMANPSIHFRHNGGGATNVLWMDGHVTTEPWGFTKDGPNIFGAYNRYARLGWFGERSHRPFGY
ncbi:MAG: type II secretion system protein [Planctomycetota bacterium]